MGPAKPRPGALTAICIIAIVLGAMGAAGGLFGMVGLLMQDTFLKIQEGFAPPWQPDEDAKAMQEFNRRLYEATGKYAPYQWVAIPLHAMVSICMIIGGILALRPGLTGRQFLTAAMIAAVPLDLGVMALGTLVQLDTLKVMGESMPTSGPPIASFMKLAGVAGLAIGVFIVLAKLVYYGWGVAILRGEKVKSWNS
jgi:hypothetical protein